MVSIVFHSPLERRALHADKAHRPAHTGPAGAPAAACRWPKPADAAPNRAREPFDWRGLWLAVLPPVLGMALLVASGPAHDQHSSSFPTPRHLRSRGQAVRRPVLPQGPERPGHRLERAVRCSAWPSALAWRRLVGIPLGFVIGRFEFINRMFNPLISLLRPVSPAGLAADRPAGVQGANPAAIWTIFICSIWPMVINTAVGVQRCRRTT
jgi:nitrate/nitrite transport system permease protein